MGLLALFVLVSVVTRWLSFRVEVLDMDEAAHAVGSWVVLDGGRLYGLSHRKRGQFFCLDAATGKTAWLSDGRQGENAAMVAAGRSSGRSRSSSAPT